ncbi:MAG: tyrosine-type recombinase/integrase [Phycisphaerae bacterium]
MPKKRSNDQIQAAYFTWKFYTRDGVFYADGRSNPVSAGRHSLGTRDRKEALELLRQLDAVIAVRKGLADKSILSDDSLAMPLLSIEDGVRQYLDYVARPAVAGGVSKKTRQRYACVFDKFTQFAHGRGIRYWQDVNQRTLEAYGRWLEEEEYSYRTQYLELTTLKQAVNWMADPQQNLLPDSAAVHMRLAKPSDESDTYCYAEEEVAAMLGHCFATDGLGCMGELIATLAYTGMRIGEAAQLRWEHVDAETGTIRIVDESRGGTRRRKSAASTKNHSSRVVPIHPHLQDILQRMSRHPDGRVFHGPRGGALKPDTARNILRRSVLAPLADKFPAHGKGHSFIDGRLHSFRHFACSKWAREGIGELVVRQWLGHKSSEIVRRYFHLNDPQARAQMQKIRTVHEVADKTTSPVETATPGNDR